MRTILTTLCEIIGAAAITAGATMFSSPVGLITGGAFLLVAGSALA